MESLDSVQFLTFVIVIGLMALVILIIVLAAMAVFAAGARIVRPRYRGAHTRAALAAAPIDGGPRDGAA